MLDETVTILLVEDDKVDAMAIERAFRNKRIANPMRIAQDGEIALDVLRGLNGQTRLERPYLILLDLNLPRMNGIEFLHELRNDPHLCDSIVFVLTTSDDDRDKLAAYKKQVAGYMVKSKAGDDFINVMELLGCYWRYIEFPPEGLRTDERS